MKWLVTILNLIYTYNDLLKHYNENDNEVDRIIDKMNSYNIKYNIYLYNILLKYYTGNVTEVDWIIDEMNSCSILFNTSHL